AANLWETPLSRSELPQRLTLGPGQQAHPRWSADARRMVFEADDLEFNISLQPLDQRNGEARGDLQPLTEGAAKKLSPSVTWDGAKIAYVSREADHWSLMVHDRTSQVDQMLLSSPERPMPRISGDGPTVVYSTLGFDLLSVPASGGVTQ